MRILFLGDVVGRPGGEVRLQAAEPAPVVGPLLGVGGGDLGVGAAAVPPVCGG